jgi:hypothetical protein
MKKEIKKQSSRQLLVKRNGISLFFNGTEIEKIYDLSFYRILPDLEKT